MSPKEWGHPFLALSRTGNLSVKPKDADPRSFDKLELQIVCRFSLKNEDKFSYLLIFCQSRNGLIGF